MAFPKPDYIQSFVDGKLKKASKSEKLSLLNDENLFKEHYALEKDVSPTISSSKLLLIPKADSSPSSSTSGFSESDDSCRCREYFSSAEAEVNRKLRLESLSRDITSETENGNRLNSETSFSFRRPSLRKESTKRTKNLHAPLKTKTNSNHAYGGISEIHQKDADTLASYTPKCLTKLGGNVTTNSSGYKLLSTFSKEDCESSKSYQRKKMNGITNQGAESTVLYDLQHKRDSDSSDSDLVPRSRRSSMESDHCHDSSDEKTEKEERKRKIAMRKLLIATSLSFVFMLGEVVGGYLASSLAIMTDASHMLSDVSSFMISILALKMASRPVSKKMTFGWHRAEVIGALISVLTIWIVTSVLVYLAVMRIVTNQYKVNGKNMLITAALAVGFNILMGLVLHEHGHLHGHSHGGHDHSHGHCHDHEAGSTASDSNESGNVNVRAAFIHVIGDLIQSLGVLTAAFIIYFKPEYKVADPICTFVFSFIVLITTVTILRDTLIVIMEGKPVNIKYNVVKEKLLEVTGVTSVHDLRIWSLTLNQTVMSAHLAIDQEAEPSSVLKRATRRLKALHNFHSLTLQVEYFSEDMTTCKKCQPA